MPRGYQSWTDQQLLEILHLRDVVGLTAREIGRRYGTTRHAIIGIWFRIEKETNATDLSPHLNGTMAPGWWKDGLRARA